MAQATARQTQYQMLHTLRFDVNFNDTGIASAVRKQTLPAGAIIIDTSVLVAAAFNAATTNVLTVGTNSAAYNNIVAAGDVAEGAAALTNAIKPTGTALGKLAADADVYALFTQTGTAATTGAATVIIRYSPNNDL